MFGFRAPRPASPAPFVDLPTRGPDGPHPTASGRGFARSNATKRPFCDIGVARDCWVAVDRASITPGAPPAPSAPGFAPPERRHADAHRPNRAIDAPLSRLGVPDVLAPVAADREQVRRLAANGQRQAVHHCLAHPQAYVRALRFREGCLELASLDGLLRAAEARRGTRVQHEWRLAAADDKGRVRRTPTTLAVRFVCEGARTPCDQATFDAERAAAYRFDLAPDAGAVAHNGARDAGERTMPRRPWHDCGWGTAVPVLVLVSLLRRGCTAEAAELLNAGCWLPERVTEAWQVAGVASGPAPHGWRNSHSPRSACLDHAHGGSEASLSLREHAGARPSRVERLRLHRRTKNRSGSHQIGGTP